MSKKITEMGGAKSYQQAMRLGLMPENRLTIENGIKSRLAVPDNAADIQKAKDPTMLMDGFTKSWETMMTALGASTGPARDGIEKLTRLMSALGGVMHDHPAAASSALWDTALGAAGLGAYGVNSLLGNPAGKAGLGRLLGGASMWELGALGLTAEIANSYGVGKDMTGPRTLKPTASGFLEGLTYELDPGIGDRIYGGNGHPGVGWGYFNPFGSAHAAEVMRTPRIPGSSPMLPGGFAGSAGSVGSKIGEIIKTSPVGVADVKGDVKATPVGVTKVVGEVSVTNLGVLVGALQAAVAAVGNRPVVLDGKAIASATMGRMAQSGRFPNSIGAPDSHSSFVSPGTPVLDAA